MRLLSSWPCAVTLATFLIGCSTGGNTSPGLPDAGPIDAQTTPDAGPRPDSGCAVRCGAAATCCAVGQECVSDRCIPTCSNNRCGDHDELCCGDGELCISGACRAPGRDCLHTGQCDPGYTCDPVVRVCVPVPEHVDCRFVPPVGVFAPEIQWEWTDGDVFSTPLVVQLSDDNHDGHVDVRDTPDVVAIAVSRTVTAGKRLTSLVALSGDDGHLLWQTAPDVAACWATAAAAGDIDGDGIVEIVAITGAYQMGTLGGTSEIQAWCAGPGSGPKSVTAFENDGTVKWRSAVNPNINPDALVSIADLDEDGSPEILAGEAVYAANGDLFWSTRSGSITSSFGYDLDGAGQQQMISPQGVYPSIGGRPLYTHPQDEGFLALGNVFGDDRPEMITSVWGNVIVIDTTTWMPVISPLLDGTSLGFSGAPTVADFDGDGRAEIGVMQARRYAVFDLFDGHVEDNYERWHVDIEDGVASTGSTLFDFDADGSVEVVFNDECHLQIRRGTDGMLLFAADNTSVTLWEYPVVADVDNDGNAELVAVANSLGDGIGNCAGRTIPFHLTESTHGVRVYRDRLDHWVPTRSIWNQYSYHIDNVNDDGTIPVHPVRSHTTHDTFRVNRLVNAEEATFAPDLSIVNLDANTTACKAQITLRARVRNGGAWGVPAGVNVAFFDASDHLVGVGQTTIALLAGGSGWAEVTIDHPAVDADDLYAFYAKVDDDGTGMGANSECNETNNTSAPLTVMCHDPI